jgi:hypothetical protein
MKEKVKTIKLTTLQERVLDYLRGRGFVDIISIMEAFPEWRLRTMYKLCNICSALEKKGLVVKNKKGQYKCKAKESPKGEYCGNCQSFEKSVIYSPKGECLQPFPAKPQRIYPRCFSLFKNAYVHPWEMHIYPCCAYVKKGNDNEL